MRQAPERFLAYGRQAIDEADCQAVIDVLRSDFLTTGPAVAAFEEAFAAYVGCDHAVACANGTAALHLAVMAAGLGPGDIGIVPANTFMATANALRFTGAEVVFADIDPATGLMTAETLQLALRRCDPSQVKAILPVHFAGHPVEMAAIKAIADQLGAVIIEDSCHAIGTELTGPDGSQQPIGAGAFGDFATFSFHPVKTLACGEGGMVTTNDPAAAHQMQLLRSHGIEREAGAFKAPGHRNAPWYHEMHALGFNMRLSDIHAALGLSQLAKLNQFVATREALVADYAKALAPLAPAVRLISQPRSQRTGWHLLVVHIDFAACGTDRAALMAALRQHNVGTQVHYIPVYRQPYYREIYGEISLPGAETYYAGALSLPLFVGMDTADVEHVAASLQRCLSL